MKPLSHVPDSPKSEKNAKLAVVTSNVENCKTKAALSDDDLGLVNAAGSDCVPTVNVDVLLGRHALPTDEHEHRP